MEYLAQFALLVLGAFAGFILLTLLAHAFIGFETGTRDLAITAGNRKAYLRFRLLIGGLGVVVFGVSWALFLWNADVWSHYVLVPTIAIPLGAWYSYAMNKPRLRRLPV